MPLCVCVLPFASVDWALNTNCLFVRVFMFGAGLFVCFVFVFYSTTFYFVWVFYSFLFSLFFRRCLSITDCVCFSLRQNSPISSLIDFDAPVSSVLLGIKTPVKWQTTAAFTLGVTR